jgi:hypothetical protein
MSRTDPAPQEPPAKKREYLKQTDVPEFSFEEALRIPRVIAEQFGKHPTRPADIALALGLLPSGRHFKGLSGAALAYGVTDAASQAPEIGLTDLGRRIVAPEIEGDDVVAMRDSFLRPRVIHEFLERYDTSTLPTDERVARNVLESFGVPSSRTSETLSLIVSTAGSLGLLADLGSKQVVNLHSTSMRLQAVPALPEEPENDEIETPEPPPVASGHQGGDGDGNEPPTAIPDVPPAPQRNSRVFVSHGSDKSIVATLKDMLEYGDFEPVVSVERETTSKPVPDKVLDDMRSCGAGIIHVGVEKVFMDADGEEHRQLNSNVLIEIGAAMALYGRNFIVLVEEGTTLPSNLQGLYEVRYEGKTIDGTATMKLLKAFKNFKS